MTEVKKAKVKVTQLLLHSDFATERDHISHTDGCIVYLDGGRFRLPALHLCWECLFDDLMMCLLLTHMVLSAHTSEIILS